MTEKNRPGEGSDEETHGIEPLLRADEAADILRVSTDWMYRAARRGLVPAVRMGGSVRFRPEDIRHLRNHGLTPDE